MVYDELRLYCIVRDDIDIPVGKLIAQAGHAFATVVHQAHSTNPEILEQYFSVSQTKIVLKAKTLSQLMRAAEECKTAGINCFLVEDAGRTVFNEPTITCLGIGPILASDLPKFVKKLRLF